MKSKELRAIVEKEAIEMFENLVKKYPLENPLEMAKMIDRVIGINQWHFHDEYEKRYFAEKNK